jgi:hypothetical protein
MADCFRRLNWLHKLQMMPRRQVPEQLLRWVPDGYLLIQNALDVLGQNEITGWNGAEMAARWIDLPPDRPWLWRGNKSSKEYFIFSGDDEVIDCDKGQAESWWTEIEPILLIEWAMEKDAKERWESCVKLMRNRLAAGTYKGLVLQRHGEFNEIPVNEWINVNGSLMLATGVAKFNIAGMVSIITRDGPAILKANFLTSNRSENQVETKNLERFPYIRLLLAATNAGLFKGNARVEKKVIEHWLQQNWPPELGNSTPTKVSTLATYLRRPEDEKGGLRGKGPDH